VQTSTFISVLVQIGGSDLEKSSQGISIGVVISILSKLMLVLQKDVLKCNNIIKVKQ